ERKEHLQKQLVQLQDMLATSKDYLGLNEEHFRDALSASLGILGVNPLQRAAAAGNSKTELWAFPALDRLPGADPTWADTLDTLRVLRRRDQKPWEWRREAQIRPVVFRDPETLDAKTVHLHLEHRVVQASSADSWLRVSSMMI